MARKRFSADEKTVIADAGAGGRVQWQNVTQWHAGELVDGVIRADDGWQSVAVRNLEGSRTVSKGSRVDVSPGHIRPAR